MDKRGLLPASIRSGANFNVYPECSLIDDRPCCLIEGLLHSVHKEIIDAMLITQI